MQRCTVCFVIVLALSLQPAARAGVDQSFEGPFNGGIFVKDILDVAQTFTVGQSGQLTQIDVFIERTATVTEDLILSILDTTVTGEPNAVLPGATASVLAASVSESPSNWVSFDLSSLNLSVTATDLLAIMLQSSTSGDGSEYSWQTTGDSGNSYSGGSVFNRVFGGAWNLEPSSGAFLDAGFRTYVTIPEPGTFALLTIATLAITHMRRPS